MDYEDGGEGQYQETVNIMDLSLGRAPEPVTSNGEVRYIPQFLMGRTSTWLTETILDLHHANP